MSMNYFYVDTREDELEVYRVAGIDPSTHAWDDAVDKYCRITSNCVVDHLDGPDHQMTSCNAQSDPDFLFDSPVEE